MLESPEFLFRIETAAADPANSAQQRLDAFSEATRLSYFLWNSTPDKELLQAAERGELDSKKGLADQVERMVKSRRLSAGFDAFLADMLEFENFDDLAKDPVIYPKFN